MPRSHNAASLRPLLPWHKLVFSPLILLAASWFWLFVVPRPQKSWLVELSKSTDWRGTKEAENDVSARSRSPLVYKFGAALGRGILLFCIAGASAVLTCAVELGLRRCVLRRVQR